VPTHTLSGRGLLLVNTIRDFHTDLWRSYRRQLRLRNRSTHLLEVQYNSRVCRPRAHLWQRDNGVRAILRVTDGISSTESPVASLKRSQRGSVAPMSGRSITQGLQRWLSSERERT